MVESKDSQSGTQRITTSLKVAVTIVVLSLVALTAEQPRLSAAPARRVGTTDEMVYFADVGSPADPAGLARPSAATPVSTATVAAPDAATPYFPAQFDAPKGDAEPLPPTF